MISAKIRVKFCSSENHPLKGEFYPLNFELLHRTLLKSEFYPLNFESPHTTILKDELYPLIFCIRQF